MTAHRLAALLAAAVVALLPTTAQADVGYPDPEPVTGQQIIHDPTVIQLKSGGYVAYSTGGVIGARLSRDRVQWDDTDSTGTPMLEGGGDLLLAGHGRYIGPGGESVFRDGGQDWLAYHYYDADDNGTPKLGLNRLSWTKAGWPVVG